MKKNQLVFLDDDTLILNGEELKNVTKYKLEKDADDGIAELQVTMLVQVNDQQDQETTVIPLEDKIDYLLNNELKYVERIKIFASENKETAPEPIAQVHGFDPEVDDTLAVLKKTFPNMENFYAEFKGMRIKLF